ncbi:MAG: hypothetical protein H0V44_16155, partial [Planctomycetes bacterium]|nr:hypothetical protein [Planctomycetota bacterium]
GAWWQATPALTFAATVKPRYTLRLANEVELRQISIDPSSGTVNSDTTTWETGGTDFIYPTSATIGMAWRAQDIHTVALDLGWTHWKEYRFRQSGREFSPINPLIDPDAFHDSYSVRLGYEHLSILPRSVVVQRVGAFYEGLPGSTRVSKSSEADLAHAKTDHFLGATAGLSLCLRSFIYDLSGQARFGNDVGAGQYVAPDKSADVLTVTLRGGVTCQF